MSQSVPLNGENAIVLPVSDMADIKRFNERFWEITKGLPVFTGSLVRISSEFYENWGIHLTDENRSALKELADHFYTKDLDERSYFRQNKEFESGGNEEDVEDSMAWLIGENVREILRSMDDGKRRFNIVDLGSNDGRASEQVASALQGDSQTAGLLKRVTFHLVDFLGRRLDAAREQLLLYDVDSKRYSQHVPDFLSDRISLGQEFDVVVSLSHFHKLPFPGYLKDVHKVLADNGAMVVGDWHSPLCSHPYYIYRFFQRSGVPSKRLELFRRLYGDRLTDPDLSKDQQDRLTPEEKMAMDEQEDFWATKCSTIEQRKLVALKPRLYLLGAYDTSRGRIAKLEDAGFTTDLDAIRKAFQRSRFTRLPKRMTGSDSAVVMVAIKRQG